MMRLDVFQIARWSTCYAVCEGGRHCQETLRREVRGPSASRIPSLYAGAFGYHKEHFEIGQMNTLGRPSLHNVTAHAHAGLEGYSQEKNAFLNPEVVQEKPVQCN